MTKRVRMAWACLALAALTITGVSAQENPYMKREKENFDKVAKHLDRYGNVFLYMNVSEIAKGIERFLGTLEKTVMPMVKDNAKPQVEQAVAAVFKGIKAMYVTSGAPGIGGLGVSSLQVGEKMYRTKTFMYSDPKKPGGLMRSLYGDKPHALTCIDYLPKETVMAVFSDFDLNLLWKWHFKLVESTQHPQFQEMHRMGLARLRAVMDMDAILGSLDKTIGCVITMDTARTLTIPIHGGQSTLTIPDPGLAFFFKTKDDTLQKFVFGKLVTTVDGKKQPIPFQTKTVEGVSYRVYPFPLPLPIQVAPSIATLGNYLIFTSSPAVMDGIITAKKKGDGLKKAPTFVKLMKNMPKQGNSFTYASPTFQKELENFQLKVMNKPGTPEAALTQKLVGAFRTEPGYTIGVGSVLEDGYLSVSESNINGAKVMMAQLALVPVAVTSIAAGMMLPVLSKAREKARRANCGGNLKQIGLACLGYSGDNGGKYPKDLATLVESNDLPASKVYLCPSAENQDVPKNAAEIRAGKCSYLYFGNGVRDDNPNAHKVVLACDKPENHNGEWINVLFADGHVSGCRESIEDAARIYGWIIPGVNDGAKVR